jgi:predicted hydrocarbon binding protein
MSDAEEGDLPVAQYYWPNKLARTYLISLEDVMGKQSLNAVLSLAGLGHVTNNYPPDNLDLSWSFENTSALTQALDEMYGDANGQRLAVRAGRLGFHHALEDFGAVLGVADLAVRLLPLRARLRAWLNAMAETFNKISDQIVRIEETDTHFLYHVDRCPMCWGRHASEPICYGGLGLLEEGVRWVSGGKDIPITETLCIAMGDPTCTYTIDKRPSQ